MTRFEIFSRRATAATQCHLST